MRIVCEPPVKYMSGPSALTPYPLSCHPHPDTPHPEQSSRITVAAWVVPSRLIGAPEVLTLPENCTYTESLLYESFCARARSHRRYAVFARAVNVSSK